jgi:monothiol glutaredoxin
MNEEIKSQIKKEIQENNIMLYMKGTPPFPMCNFSSTVIDILNHYEVKFGSANVLDNEDLRQGIKDFSDWPTVPQLYVKGEFVGGCDILVEMHKNGDLETVLK